MTGGCCSAQFDLARFAGGSDPFEHSRLCRRAAGHRASQSRMTKGIEALLYHQSSIQHLQVCTTARPATPCHRMPTADREGGRTELCSV